MPGQSLVPEARRTVVLTGSYTLRLWNGADTWRDAQGIVPGIVKFFRYWVWRVAIPGRVQVLQLVHTVGIFNKVL